MALSVAVFGVCIKEAAHTMIHKGFIGLICVTVVSSSTGKDCCLVALAAYSAEGVMATSSCCADFLHWGNYGRRRQ